MQTLNRCIYLIIFLTISIRSQIPFNNALDSLSSDNEPASIHHLTNVISSPQSSHFRHQSHRELQAVNSEPSKEKCEKYNEKGLLDNDKMFMRNQTLLLSFPGSGNSWLRLLIEVATGIYTGSIYTDETLSALFPTEDRCGLRMSVIKGHPKSFEVCDNYLCIKQHPAHSNRKYYLKCLGGTIKNFKKFLFVARDPMKSIWSEFQLIVSGQHNESVTSSDRHMIRYWQTHAKRALDAFANDYYSSVYPMLVAHSPENFQWIKYENLVDKSTRLAELRKVPDYLQLHIPINPERVECAFELSDNIRIHRQSVFNGTSMVHDHLIAMACYAWERIGNYSRVFGYPNPWPEVVC